MTDHITAMYVASAFGIDANKKENKKEPLPSERNLCQPKLEGSGETQMGQGPLPSAELSVTARIANLHFYAAKKEAAFHAHKQAIMEYEEALTALNNALTKKHFWDGN